MTDDKLRAADGYVLEYDAEYWWLVMSDPEGASQIVAKEVRPEDAAYLIAGYEALAAYATDEGKSWTANVPKPPKAVIHQSVVRPAVPEALDVERLIRVLTNLDPDTGQDDWLIYVSQTDTYETSRREWAEAIAREYAALRSKEPTDAP